MPKPLKLTAESIHRYATPVNRCSVKQLLDSLDEESRAVLEYALAQPAKVLSSPTIRKWLIEEGADPAEAPSATRISDHRSGRGACKCPRA